MAVILCWWAQLYVCMNNRKRRKAPRVWRASQWKAQTSTRTMWLSKPITSSFRATQPGLTITGKNKNAFFPCENWMRKRKVNSLKWKAAPHDVVLERFKGPWVREICVAYLHLVFFQCSCHWAPSPARVFQWEEQIQNAWDVSVWSVHNTVLNHLNLFICQIFKSLFVSVI